MFQVGGRAGKICYSRPSARGRVVFGELVPFGRLWRTGANEPTMLHLPVRAEVAGVPLEPGAYMVLTVPGPDRWQVLLNTSEATEPLAWFNDHEEVGRGEVPVAPLDDHVETFIIRAADAGPGATLILEWERTRLGIPIRPLP